jgi:DHA1 family tetracycline resistance protein-like MFS transporter
MILIAALLDIMSMGIVFPVLPILIRHFTGSDQSAGIWTGVIASLWAVMQFLCAPAIGCLSDRYGRRPVILVSTAGMALAWVLMASAPNLWWLVAARAIAGVTSATGTVIFAYMADITPSEKRARAFGLVGAAFSVGFIAGPVLGGMLGQFSPQLPFWVAACLSGTAFLYGLIILPESLKPEGRTAFSWMKANPAGALKLLRSHRELTGLATISFLLNSAHQIFGTVLVLYAGHRYGIGAFGVGVLLAMASLLDLIVQGALVGRVATRLGDRPTMIVGLAAGACGLLIMGLAPTPILFAVALLPNAMWGLAYPTMQSLMSQRVSDSEQGQLQGANHSVASIAGFVGPLFFGWVYGLSAASLPGLSFFIAASILLLAACCGLLVAHRARVDSAAPMNSG